MDHGMGVVDRDIRLLPTIFCRRGPHPKLESCAKLLFNGVTKVL